jgi:hypothetical protein
VWQGSQIQFESLDSLERALRSILASETRDWNRLLSSSNVQTWHAKQVEFPVPADSDILRTIDTTDGVANIPIPTGMGKGTEWSLVMELQTRGDRQSVVQLSQPIVRQHAAGSNSRERQAIVEWNRGKIRVRLLHGGPFSFIQIETSDIVAQPGNQRLAIVYDGTQAADALGIWIDGRFAPFQVQQDFLVRDFMDASPQVLEFPEAATPDADCAVQELACYRVALSEAELIGIDQDREWKVWDECSPQERLLWAEHYARRVDPQWRYQRESLLFYGAQFSALLDSLDVAPILSPEDPVPSRFWSSLSAEVPFPRNLFLGEDRVAVDLEWEDRRLLASALEQSMAIPLARAEVDRQWRSLVSPVSSEALTEWRGPVTSVWTVDERNRVADLLIRSGWDRRAMMQAMVSSQSWVTIAIDSPP